jgi:hypothetical protein
MSDGPKSQATEKKAEGEVPPLPSPRAQQKAAQPGGLQAFDSAYTNYLEGIQKIQGEVQKRSDEAQQQLAQTLLEGSQTGTQSPAELEEAQRKYQQDLQDAWAESQKGYESEYRQYTKALGEAFSRLDSGQLEVNALMAIGQSIQVAASCASSTLGSWCLVGHWGTKPYQVVLGTTAIPE